MHGVRWFSSNSALEAIYLTWNAVCVALEAQGDGTAKGILKNLKTVQFVGVTAVLMDIIPLMTKLNLTFQKQDLDLAMVYPTLQATISELQRFQKEGGPHMKQFLEVNRLSLIISIALQVFCVALHSLFWIISL